MNAWDDLIGRLTHRLEVDEELRLDVARELHGHLEDSAAEFRAAGQSESEAAASAAKALGDEQDLAEQLWQANRTRIRLRGVLRWTARVTLLPAAVAVVLVIFTYLVGVSGYFRSFESGGGWSGGPGWPMGPLGKLVCDPYVGVPLTADQRLLLEGAPDAHSEADKAKSIADRWPDSPVYYADYVARLLYQPGFRRERTDEQTERFDEVMFAETLAALRTGERIDPSNAFYNAEAASLLIQASSTLHEDPSATYDKLKRTGEVEPGKIFTVQITDPQGFQQGLEEFHRALAKPLWTSRSMEMLRLRLNALGVPTRMIQYFNRLALWMSVPLPGLADARELGKSLDAYARVLAEKGKVQEGVQLLEDVRRLAAKMGAHPDFPVGLLVAQGMTTHALGCQEVFYHQLGRSDQAAQARQERMGEYEFLNGILAGPRPIETPQAEGALGIVERVLLPSLPGYERDLRAVRIAEQFVLAEFAMCVLLAVLVVAAVLVGVTVVVERIAVGKPDRGVLVFVGWRRIGRICLLAVAAPLAVYAVYAGVAAPASRTPGLTLRNADRMVLEFVAVGSLVLAMLGRMSYTAIRQRACELGLTTPAPVRWRDRPVAIILAAILAIVVVGYLIGWWTGHFRRSFPRDPDAPKPGELLSVLVFGTVAVYGVWQLVAGPQRGRQYKRFRRTWRRSLIPILAALVIVLGVALGGVLAVGEGWAIKQTGAGMPMPDEIANSDFRLLQERFIEMDKSFRQGAGEPGAASGR